VEELLGYGVHNVFSVLGPCRSFIGDNEGRLQSVVEREAEWREASAVKIDCNCNRRTIQSSNPEPIIISDANPVDVTVFSNWLPDLVVLFIALEQLRKFIQTWPTESGMCVRFFLSNEGFYFYVFLITVLNFRIYATKSMKGIQIKPFVSKQQTLSIPMEYHMLVWKTVSY
jgi:hypothetical protein